MPPMQLQQYAQAPPGMFGAPVRAAALVPFTHFVRNELIDRRECLLDVLPMELYGVLNPAEYASTIAEFQSATYPAELRRAKLWFFLFFGLALLVAAVPAQFPALWIPLLLLLLALVVGMCIRGRMLQLAYASRESGLHAFAARVTMQYNSIQRQAAFGPLGGGGWRIEWTVHRERSDMQDCCGRGEGSPESSPFRICIQMKQTQHQPRVFEVQVIQGRPHNAGADEGFPQLQQQHQQQPWQPTPHPLQSPWQQDPSAPSGLAMLSTASTELDTVSEGQSNV